MLRQNVPELFKREQPSPWGIAIRVILLMVMLVATVWLIKSNPLTTDQNTQVGNKDKKVSDERQS